ncbi:MAG: hypothetical protein EOP83_22450, partial [Verrucomicrobiaceae bacterium]
DDELGQRVAAAVIPAPGSRPSEESLRQALRETLSTYKIPRNIVFITDDDIRLTATGKLKLTEMAELVAERVGVAPITTVQLSIANAGNTK